MIIMRKAEINEIKERKERNDEVCVGNTRLVKVFSYRLTGGIRNRTNRSSTRVGGDSYN